MSDESNVIRLDEQRKHRERKDRSQKEQEFEDLLEAADEFLDQTPMWEVLKLGCYFIRKEDGTAIPVKKAHFGQHFPGWSEKFAKAVTFRLAERRWTFHDATYSFHDVPADTLNLMDKSQWLQPTDGEYHKVFELLCISIGGGKPENVDHLKHCIAYKYLHPEAFTLPNLVIHGEGSVGKNFMVNEVLRRVFHNATLSSPAENITGSFNSLLGGMVVAMVDESMAEKTCSARLKTICGNKFIAINTKQVPQYMADNTAWYWICSNEKENGGIWLDKSHADRRYSVFHIEDGLTLEYWIARYHDWLDANFTDEQYDRATKRAKLWLKSEGVKLLTDRDQIRAWLGSLLKEYGDREHPLALHGVDYLRLADVQQRVCESMIEAVFNDERFTHIRKSTLYRGYEICAKAAGERGKVGSKVFYRKVNDWLKRNKTRNIIEDRERQDTGRNAIWYDSTKPEHIRRTDNTFMYLTDSFNPCWIGPEVV